MISWLVRIVINLQSPAKINYYTSINIYNNVNDNKQCVEFLSINLANN